MMMATILHISDFIERGLLRRRGEQVYEKLSQLLETDEVELNLDGTRSMSMSFIDGIVLSLLNNGQLEKITFITDRETSLRKLSRIVEIRNIPIYYRSSEQLSRSLVPKSQTPKSQPVFVPQKSERVQAYRHHKAQIGSGPESQMSAD